MDMYPLVEAHSELQELQELRDAAHAAEAQAREAAATGPSMTHDAFMAQLEAEDREAAAS